MLTLAQWQQSGQVTPIRLKAGTFDIFYRTEGAGHWLTFLHGFPTSSWDWAKISPVLAQQHHLLLFDFLGFGASAKPANHTYSIHAQADLTVALWEKMGIQSTGLIAHDYGVSVAQELLGRQHIGTLSTTITRVIFLNGGLYSHLHRPRLIQKLLNTPLLGAIIARLITERAFNRSFLEVFAIPPTPEELHQHWESIVQGGGQRIYHRLIRYIEDRKQHHERWTNALAQTAVPLSFVWGMRDPVSGAHMLAEVQRQLPTAPVTALADVGHYPQLEAPDRVLAAIA